MRTAPTNEKGLSAANAQTHHENGPILGQVPRTVTTLALAYRGLGQAAQFLTPLHEAEFADIAGSGGAGAYFRQVLDTPQDTRIADPTAWLYHSRILSKFQWGWERTSVRRAARRISCVYPHPHPHRLDPAAGGFCLDTEPETMSTNHEGQRAHVPAHYLRRLARSLILRAGINGRLSWPVVIVMLDRIGGAA